MAAWAKAYAANSGVKTIKMTQNGIRQEGISHLITNGLAHLSRHYVKRLDGPNVKKGKNKKVEVLRLQFNDINAKGLAGLASASSSALPALRRVEINGNKFDEEDPSIEKLRSVLDERKEASGEHEDDEEYWGLDELDELESEDEDEEESDAEEKRGDADDDEEGVEVEEKAARQIVEDTKAEESNVPQEKDKKVDDLADLMSKTEIK